MSRTTSHTEGARSATGANKALRRRRSYLVSGATLAALIGIGTAGLSSGFASASSNPSGQVALVAYSTPQPAYGVLIRAFQKTSAGRNVTFTTSFGPSGSQSRSVVAGLPADVVNFSLVTDVERLVSKKLVRTTWNADPTTHGMVTDSLVVFVVPKGNPLHIATWADLLKPGVRVFTPNPFSSGSARWNLVAAYGAQLKQGKSPQAAQDYLRKLLSKTVNQGASAADELTAFTQDASRNKHDVLLDYEDDAIQAKRAGARISYVIPKQTILIENPIAVTTVSRNPTAARAFAQYLLSPAGQRTWAELGYRSVRPAIEAKFRAIYPVPSRLFTIQYVGGWDQITTSFFSTSTSSPGIVTRIEQSLGISTASG